MLGLALINECIQQNCDVYAIVRKDSAKLNRLPKSSLIHIVECELKNFKSLTLERAGFDAFFHYAWECTDSLSRNEVDVQNRNISHTLDAVRLAYTLKCKKFIGAGSQAEYGRVSGKISPNMPVAPENAYGVAKYAAGRMAAILCDQLGMPFIWTRIFSTYGINDMSSTMIMYIIASLLKGEKPALTKCEQQWDYLYCKDAAKAFYLIGEKGNSGSIYNIGTGKVRPLLEYVRIIRDAIDSSLPLGIGEREYAPSQVMNLHPDIGGLVSDTGFSPSIPFEQGIQETIEWYKGLN